MRRSKATCWLFGKATFCLCPILLTRSSGNMEERATAETPGRYGKPTQIHRIITFRDEVARNHISATLTQNRQAHYFHTKVEAVGRLLEFPAYPRRGLPDHALGPEAENSGRCGGGGQVIMDRVRSRRPLCAKSGPQTGPGQAGQLTALSGGRAIAGAGESAPSAASESNCRARTRNEPWNDRLWAAKPGSGPDLTPARTFS
jgi:hypothetical protein